jgi:hypothetical protein
MTMTPFVGPIPPSNLLDRVAKSITKSKGSHEWPHSVRATRAKLLEVSRERGKRISIGEVSIPEEEKENEDTDVDVKMDRPNSASGPENASDAESTLGRAAGKRKLAKKDGVPAIGRRPIYRQSSMDFLNLDGGELAGLGSR